MPLRCDEECRLWVEVTFPTLKNRLLLRVFVVKVGIIPNTEMRHDYLLQDVSGPVAKHVLDTTNLSLIYDVIHTRYAPWIHRTGRSPLNRGARRLTV